MATEELLIGMRLRREREARRLGLAEVALRSGLTKSFLSRVERDQTSPSLASLMSICDAIGVTISDLLARPQTRVIRATERTTIAGLPGASVIDTLITPRTQRHMTVMETVVGPGGSAGEEFYTLPSEFEACFVLDGELDFDIEGVHYVLGAGDALSFGAGVPHTWRNTSSKKGARFLTMLSPALPDQFSVTND
jgi:transcriptional regulator with XRE-family HTH domain